MGVAGRAEDRRALGVEVGGPHVLDPEHAEQRTGGLPEGKAVTRAEPAGDIRRDVEGDRHRPEGAVGQAHLLADRFVVGPAEEAGQRRHGPGDQQVEIAAGSVGRAPSPRDSRANARSSRRRAGETSRGTGTDRAGAG